MEPISGTAPVSCLKGCVALVQEILKLRAGLQFHIQKGGELVRRCALLMEYLDEVIQSGPIQQTAAGALEQLQEHLVRAYEVLQKCGRGRVYRVINYRAIQDEIIDVNTSISVCLGDNNSYNSIPRASQPHLKRLRADVRAYGPLSVEEGVADGIPEAASEIEIEETNAVVETIQELSRQGVFSEAELAAFQAEVSASNAERDQMLTLLGIMGEEQQMLAAQKLASEEQYLRQIAALILATTPTTMEPPAPPDRFVCPLTQDIMSDPVIVTSGRVYERSAIERWLKDHDTCPVNRVPVDPNILIRVLDLKAEIAEWQSSNQSAKTPVASSSTRQIPPSTIRRITDPGSPSGVIIRLVRNLDTNDPRVLYESLQQLRYLAVDAANKRAIAAIPGSLHRLVGLLESGSQGVQERAAGALRYLAFDAINRGAILAVPGSLVKLVALLESGSEGVQENAAKALCNLAHGVANKWVIAKVPGTLQMLVALLQSRSEGVQEGAAGALGNLACDGENIRAITAVPGSLERIVDLLESESEGVQMNAARALCNLAEADGAYKNAIAAVPGSLQKLVRLLESGSNAVQDSAVLAVRHLAVDVANQRAIAAVPGSLQKLVGLLESGSVCAKENAAAVLWHLAANAANQRAIAAVPGSLQKLVSLLESHSEDVQKTAVGALQNLAADAANRRAIAATPGSIQKLRGLRFSGNEAIRALAMGALAKLDISTWYETESVIKVLLSMDQ